MHSIRSRRFVFDGVDVAIAADEDAVAGAERGEAIFPLVGTGGGGLRAPDAVASFTLAMLLDCVLERNFSNTWGLVGSNCMVLPGVRVEPTMSRFLCFCLMDLHSSTYQCCHCFAEYARSRLPFQTKHHTSVAVNKIKSGLGHHNNKSKSAGMTGGFFDIFGDLATRNTST